MKVLSCWFDKRLAPINTLAIQKGSEAAISRECFNQVLDSL